MDFKAEATLAATAGTTLAGSSDGTRAGRRSVRRFSCGGRGLQLQRARLPAADAAVVAVFTSFTERMCREGQRGTSARRLPPADRQRARHRRGHSRGGQPAGPTASFTGRRARRRPASEQLSDEPPVRRRADAHARADAGGLEAAIAAGKFVLHNVNGAARVLGTSTRSRR